MVFAENALRMHDYGLAVLPIDADRQPLVSGFNRWRTRPSEKTVAGWAAEHPDSNIAVHPGLSGVIVVDVDDASQDAAVQCLLGDTPLQVQTRRGVHRYYRKPSERLPGSLRAYGLNVDLKSGSGIVIAPPSVHESGHVYRLKDCDWSTLQDLPSPNFDNLRKSDGRTGPTFMRDGSRGQWLNDQLCARVFDCHTPDELLLVAYELNGQLNGRELAPLAERDVIKRADKVWADAQAGQLRRSSAYRGVIKSSVAELDLLGRLSPKLGPDGLFLLFKLRHEHSARCRRGKSFCLTPRAMADAGVIPGWTRERYQKARDLLLQARLILRISPFRCRGSRREAAQYVLAECHADYSRKVERLGGAGGC